MATVAYNLVNRLKTTELCTLKKKTSKYAKLLKSTAEFKVISKITLSRVAVT